MTPRLLRAAAWIKKARATTMRLDDAGRKMPYYGLIPRGEWCDIGEWEHWFFTSAFFYRSLHDIAEVLRFVDEKEAADVQAEVQAFREDILRAVDRSTDHESDPPLIPLAPCVRQPYAGQQDLQSNIYGHYWSIAGPNVLMYCGVVNPNDERATWILKCLEQRNGFLLGNARFGSGIDAKYGYPSMVTYLRRDEITKVLLHLYGFRAYGMSRDTASTPEVAPEVKTGGTNPRWWTPCLPDRFANARFLASGEELVGPRGRRFVVPLGWRSTSMAGRGAASGNRQCPNLLWLAFAESGVSGRHGRDPLHRTLAKPIAGRPDDVAIAASNLGSAQKRDHQWAALD